MKQFWVDTESNSNLIINCNMVLMDSSYTIKWIVIHNLKDYPWLKDLDHLKRVNKYRKRHGQIQLNFNDDDLSELALTGR